MAITAFSCFSAYKTSGQWKKKRGTRRRRCKRRRTRRRRRRRRKRRRRRRRRRRRMRRRRRRRRRRRACTVHANVEESGEGILCHLFASTIAMYDISQPRQHSRLDELIHSSI